RGSGGAVRAGGAAAGIARRTGAKEGAAQSARPGARRAAAPAPRREAASPGTGGARRPGGTGAAESGRGVPPGPGAGGGRQARQAGVQEELRDMSSFGGRRSRGGAGPAVGAAQQVARAAADRHPGPQPRSRSALSELPGDDEEGTD